MLLMADAGVTGLLADLSMGVLWAAILMPAGFFLSVVGRNLERPNSLRYLIYRRTRPRGRRRLRRNRPDQREHRLKAARPPGGQASCPG